ncbi:hypothetical protein [Methylobacterium sp. WSM2598]|uniref:hypothetical protein n=1 Tax=Methylobacterium sp. WSM2598 TaxID=398261 RepID=UPI00037BB8D1|nr:hypothetical protein [Methylobacterium sp. WSM2598]
MTVDTQGSEIAIILNEGELLLGHADADGSVIHLKNQARRAILLNQDAAPA